MKRNTKTFFYTKLSVKGIIILYVVRKLKKYKAGGRMNYTVTEGNYLKFGLQEVKDGVIFTFAGEKEDVCAVILYDRSLHVADRVEAPAAFCRGAVRSICIQGLKTKNLFYNYEINGEVITDAYAKKIAGREKWNDVKRADKEYLICGSFEESAYEWQSAGCPEIPKNEMFMYKLHVRGFSMDSGKKGKMRGTFLAVEDQIPYLKALGVTTVEFMPLYEFEEMEIPKKQKLPGYIPQDNTAYNETLPDTEAEHPKVNYWGYTKGFYFAPKASYSCSKNVAQELKHLIDTLHQNQIECVLEMYFEKEENQNLILDALRYWATEFCVDGFHLIGDNVPITAIAQDLFLRRSKIFYPYIPEQLWKEKENYPHLFVYNEEYLYTARKLLNHQGGSLFEFSNQQKKQNATVGFVNFIANNNGFTLADLFSYCEKHNEANGEDNADGSNYNFSMNCGAEGKTSKKYVRELRRKHLYMALSMLFFAQGVPLLLAGDEALNSQQGNNNAYCQDNKTGWVNWKHIAGMEQLQEFVTKLAAFRRLHPILHKEEPMHLNDYKHKGCPDLSYHSDNAWVAGFPEEKGAFGVMYCGDYTNLPSGEPDDMIYIGYNFHTGVNELALPKLAEKKKWYIIMDTAEQEQAFLPVEKLAENQHRITVRPQSVVVLLGK